MTKQTLSALLITITFSIFLMSTGAQANSLKVSLKAPRLMWDYDGGLR